MKKACFSQFVHLLGQTHCFEQTHFICSICSCWEKCYVFAEDKCGKIWQLTQNGWHILGSNKGKSAIPVQKALLFKIEQIPKGFLSPVLFASQLKDECDKSCTGFDWDEDSILHVYAKFDRFGQITRKFASDLLNSTRMRTHRSRLPGLIWKLHKTLKLVRFLEKYCQRTIYWEKCY